MWCGPWKKRGEAGSRVFLCENLDLVHQPSLSWKVIDMSRESDPVLNQAAMDIEISFAGCAVVTAVSFPGVSLGAKKVGPNDAGFVETSDDGVEDDVPFCWIVTNSEGFLWVSNPFQRFLKAS